MHVNLIRPCVGMDSPQALYEHQINHRGIVNSDGNKLNFFDTRNTPKRKDEILNGGSVYWIIKGAIVMRQTIVGIETLLDENNKKFCRIIKSPEIMLTTPQPHRAMQGWRYFEAEKAPADLYPLSEDNLNNQDELDPDMAKELSELGLL